ncbi:MAG TPA: PrsW family glutamic-type intramembrane protease [Bacilli bacterium]|nr:PrsW family glutamic-type intramembrane protease [Bacilli bacterium]
MDILLLIGCAVAPGIALLSFFYLRDLYESEPLRMVGRLFLLGLLSAIPVMYLVSGLDRHIASPYVHTFLAVAVVEELSKFVLAYWFAFRHREFDEEYDGIVYAVAVSLGFATAESVIKVLTLGWSTIPVRTLFTVPGHALFAVIMGFYLGRAKFADSSKKRALFFTLSLGYPWLVHGIYDSLLISNRIWIVALTIPLMIWLWVSGLRKVRHAQERSPFKPIDRKATDV